MEKTAELSSDKKYRYCLGRDWSKPCLFIMLNPSTADHEVDDATIKKCIHFAKREGCSSLKVVNLYALRATDPSALLSSDNPTGSHNNAHIVSQIENAKNGLLICAWGSHKATKEKQGDIRNILKIARGEGMTPMCFEINKDGNPKHPLYVANDKELMPYEAEEE